MIQEWVRQLIGLTCRWSGARNQAAIRWLPVVHLLVSVYDRLSLQATAGIDPEETLITSMAL